MGRSWGRVGCLGPVLGSSWGILGGLGGLKAILNDSFTFSSHFRSRSGLIWTVLGLSWALFGPSWACLEASWACLGEVLGSCWLSWAHLGLSWGILGGLGSLKAILNDSFTFSSHFRSRWGLIWTVLGPSWALFDPSWACLEALGAVFGKSWGRVGCLGPVLGASWADLGHLGRPWRPEGNFERQFHVFNPF